MRVADAEEIMRVSQSGGDFPITTTFSSPAAGTNQVLVESSSGVSWSGSSDGQGDL